MELTTLIIIVIVCFISLILGLIIGYLLLKRNFENKLNSILKSEREDAIKRSRAVIGGQFSEQLAPYLPEFPYKPTEIKFLGKPIDFIVFKGSDENLIDEIIFVEVKSGNAKLNKQEKNLKETILAKRVRWDEYKIPEELTK